MKKYIIPVLIGILIFPTVSLGGTFVSSLIEGKTVEEAVSILGEQLDVLIGRVDKLEKDYEAIQEDQESQITELKEFKEKFEKEREVEQAYKEFRKIYEPITKKGGGEEATIRLKEEYCQRSIEEGDKNERTCNQAERLRSTWETYQQKKIELENS